MVLSPYCFSWRGLSLLFCLASLVTTASAHKQTNWLTITGTPDQPQTDLIEVDPESRSSSKDFPALNIRVSRALLRTSSDGVPFRSYTATVMVDCNAKTARFVSATFYMMPLWQGNPHKTWLYSSTEIRPMLFRSIEPNPTLRIIRAACPHSAALAG